VVNLGYDDCYFVLDIDEFFTGMGSTTISKMDEIWVDDLFCVVFIPCCWLWNTLIGITGGRSS
jgi:hypothetical protein